MAKRPTLSYGNERVKNATFFSCCGIGSPKKTVEVEFYLKMCENTAHIEDKRGQCDGQSSLKGTKVIRKDSCVCQLHDIS